MYQSLVSCLMSPVSCLLSHVSCFTSPVSCILSHVSCLTSPVSHLLPHISCLTSPVLNLLSHVSCLLSHMPSTVPNYFKLFLTKINSMNQQYYTISLSVSLSFNFDFHAKFGSGMAWKWRELAPFYFRATATVPFFLHFRATMICATFFILRQLAFYFAFFSHP